MVGIDRFVKLKRITKYNRSSVSSIYFNTALLLFYLEKGIVKLTLSAEFMSVQSSTQVCILHLILQMTHLDSWSRHFLYRVKLKLYIYIIINKNRQKAIRNTDTWASKGITITQLLYLVVSLSMVLLTSVSQTHAFPEN